MHYWKHWYQAKWRTNARPFSENEKARFDIDPFCLSIVTAFKKVLSPCMDRLQNKKHLIF